MFGGQCSSKAVLCGPVRGPAQAGAASLLAYLFVLADPMHDFVYGECVAYTAVREDIRRYAMDRRAQSGGKDEERAAEHHTVKAQTFQGENQTCGYGISKQSSHMFWTGSQTLPGTPGCSAFKSWLSSPFSSTAPCHGSTWSAAEGAGATLFPNFRDQGVFDEGGLGISTVITFHLCALKLYQTP